MSQTRVIDEIKKAIHTVDGKWNEKKGIWGFSATIAERKAFLSKKKLTYTARLKIDDNAKTVRFSEMLVEAGSGLSSGGSMDDGMSVGFGSKTETYNTFNSARQGTIQEQSTLFGKDYKYQFDYKEIGMNAKEIIEKLGYKFEYQILPVK